MTELKPENVKRGPGNLAKIYLLVYNSLQVCGWSHVLFQTLNYYLKSGDENTGIWEMVNPSLLIFQTAACLEVVHVATGLVRTNLLTTFFQVNSRVFVVWLELFFLPATRESVGVPLLLIAWCVTEIVRYSYYALGILNKIPYFITWARYTFFFILYPIGVTGEVLVVIKSISVGEQSPFHIQLPNAFNVSANYVHAMYMTLVFYALVFPRMYGHMISQRRKVLGKASAEEGTKTKAFCKYNGVDDSPIYTIDNHTVSTVA